MKVINYKLYKKIYLLICFLLVVTCDFIKDENGKAGAMDIIDSTQVNTSKDEARLLVRVTKNNLEVMELLKILQSNKVNPTATKRLSKLMNTHINILNYYAKVAQKNLISTPKLAGYGYDTIVVDDTTKLLKYTNRLVNKIDEQLMLTDQIVSTTKKTDFKVMAFETKEFLKLNLEETKLLLKDLKN